MRQLNTAAWAQSLTLLLIPPARLRGSVLHAKASASPALPHRPLGALCEDPERVSYGTMNALGKLWSPWASLSAGVAEPCLLPL